MRNFCTYFNAAYIWKGLAMYESLSKVSDDFCLYIMALDEKTFQHLKKLNLPNMVVECWCNYETEQFLSLKEERTFAEYCWTCGPTIIQHFMKSNNLPDITYLDSDLMFYNSFNCVYDEIGSHSIAITRHYSVNEEQTGKYCVQFVYFKNDEEGNAALQWWKERCIEWCFTRIEKDRYADQKYLDFFPQRYKNVCIISNRGAGIAPWNMNHYSICNKSIIKYNDIEYPLVFFHFHGVKMDFKDDCLVAKFFDKDFPEDKHTTETLFIPYIEIVLEILNKYMGLKVNKYTIKRNTLIETLYYKLRFSLRNNYFAKLIYYRLHKYQGKESLKL